MDLKLKIKTLEELEEKIANDFEWRKKELFTIKFQIENSVDENFVKVLIRSGIALLCSHWEGFIRSASNYYIIYINSLKIPHNEIKPNFVALKVQKEVLRAGKSEKVSVHTRLIEYIQKMTDELFYIKYSDNNRIIKTNSNLSYELFSEILNSISINNIYELKKQYIDRNLLKNRHEVVHGEKTFLDQSDFIETNEIVLEIMESFKTQIIEAANNESFRIT